MPLDKISPVKVKDEGQKLKTHATKILQTLDQVKDSMDSTKNAIDSRGGEAIRDNFNKNAAKFQEFKKQIDDYGQYLIDYAQEHDKADKDITTKAEEFATITTKG